MTKTSVKDTMDNSVAIREAQSDMRKGYADGSIGIIVSGSMWLISALVAYYFSDKLAIWTLLIGGALINPVGVLIEKIMGFKGHQAGNPLKNLAMESTVWMIMCLPIAYGLSLQQVAWFFMAMLLIIGGRYLTFATLYGKKIYWVFGGTLGVAAYLLFRFDATAFVCLLTGALVEIVFGIYMYVDFQSKSKRHV